MCVCVYIYIYKLFEKGNLLFTEHVTIFFPTTPTPEAGAVIHTHSKAAVMATLVFPGKEFKITHQEMIKGIKKCTSGGYYRYLHRCPPPCHFFLCLNNLNSISPSCDKRDPDIFMYLMRCYISVLVNTPFNIILPDLFSVTQIVCLPSFSPFPTQPW